VREKSNQMQKVKEKKINPFARPRRARPMLGFARFDFQPHRPFEASDVGEHRGGTSEATPTCLGQPINDDVDGDNDNDDDNDDDDHDHDDDHDDDDDEDDDSRLLTSSPFIRLHERYEKQSSFSLFS
jgi:hypothetical protein